MQFRDSKISSNSSITKSRTVSKKLHYETLEPRQLLAATGTEAIQFESAQTVTIAPQPVTSSTTSATKSGNWTDASVWSDGVPSNTVRALIPNGRTVTLNGTNHFAKELVIQGVLQVAESPGVDKTLSSDWIHVNSGGVFQIGTASNRYDANDFVIRLTGTDPTETFNIEGVPMPVTNNNGFLMAAGGGRLQFFGQHKLTYTKLAATANVNTNQIIVEKAIDRDFDGDIDAADGSFNWEVGDEIVIASSSEDYDDEEVRTITALADIGGGRMRITLNQNLNNRHYGEIETYSNDTRTWDLDLRAEVAVLNRNVRIEGLAAQDTDNFFGDRARFNAGTGAGFGGHTMIMPSAGQITVDSVQFDRMGQTARLGRYPIHWHLAGDRTGDVLRGASITNSNNRGMTIHGTHNVLIQDVLLHDIHGHGFFMEDGVETGNQYRGNIAFGIHKVGRSAAVGNFAPDVNDPFIVDTHDHVGQNQNRFLSSAAYWVTNPDNVWVGNVSAGSEGTGFWFIFPDRAIGDSANDPQYNNVRPNRTNLRQFDFNSSHASPAGLNFDRGSDLEVPVGGNIKANFDGDNWLPSQEPQINNFTAYKHNVAIYHRGFDANFHDNKIADSNISTFITFTQRITDTLYVGHSRGNADTSDYVTGHTIYDGANTLDGTHFAGFAANNAHTFRVNGSATRHTSHVMTNTSFEDDGSAGHVSIASQGGGPSQTSPFDFSPAAIYDADGTLTSHVGGGPGSTVVTNHPFFYDANDIRPTGWNAVVSDDIYAMLRFSPDDSASRFRVTAPDGDQITDQGNTRRNTHVKAADSLDPNNDYRIELASGSLTDGFDFRYTARTGPAGSTVLRFVGFGDTLRPQNMNRATTLDELRAATQTTFTVVDGDVYIKAFTNASDIDMGSFTTTNPNANNDQAVTDEGNSVIINVLSNDSDIDGDSLTVVPGTNSVVVTDYSDDFKTGTPANGWQYLWNENGTFGNVSSYSTMPADGSAYSPASQQYLNLRAGSGHPGSGVDQGVAFDLYAIAAYTVASDGQYSIADSFLARGGSFGDGVGVMLHVGNTVREIGSIAAQSSSDFDTSLGFLSAGTTIYIGVGPDGPGAGSSAGNDYFTWDFSIRRQSTNGNGQVSVNADQSITYTPAPGFSGIDTFSYQISDDRGGTNTATVVVTVNEAPTGTVGSQYLFYKDSGFDIGSHRNAIATDKTAALPGQATQFSNFSSFNRGLNGIIVDVENFSATPTINDFEFRVGNDGAPSTWPLLTATTGIEFTAGAGAGGSDQITLTWADNEIENQWLRVTLKANANTNLATDHVFYFGNQIGDTNGDVDINNRVRVNAFDTVRTRLNNGPTTTVAIDNVYDVDRSGLVNAFDTIRVRLNQELSGLLMFTTPLTPPSVPVMSAPIFAAVITAPVISAEASIIKEPLLTEPLLTETLLTEPRSIEEQQSVLSAPLFHSDFVIAEPTVDARTRINLTSYWLTDAHQPIEPSLADQQSDGSSRQSLSTFSAALAGAEEDFFKPQEAQDEWFGNYEEEADPSSQNDRLELKGISLDELVEGDGVFFTT